MVQDATAQQPLVSVVIPTFNEERHIRHCLRSVLNQHTTVSFEVIVVDSSTDSTPQIVQAEFPQVRLIRRNERTFPAEARNLGVEQSRGQVVAFVDADCQADASWIEAIVAAHQQAYLAVGGSVSLARPYTVAGAALFVVEFSEYLPGGSPREARWLPSCNLSVKREAFSRYGGFPTAMEASEDIIFTRHLAIGSGVPLWFDPRIRVTHTNLNSMEDVRGRLRKLGYWSGRSRQSGLVTGKFLSRFPFLTPLLVPYRLARIVGRLLRRLADWRLLLWSILCWPLLAYALCIWARGFRRGLCQMPPESAAGDPSDRF